MANAMATAQMLSHMGTSLRQVAFKHTVAVFVPSTDVAFAIANCGNASKFVPWYPDVLNLDWVLAEIGHS